MPGERYFEVEDLSEYFEPPVLIVSTVVGRGMYAIGEAIRQRLGDKHPVHHVPVEEFVSPEVVNEDLERYNLFRTTSRCFYTSSTRSRFFTTANT